MSSHENIALPDHWLIDTDVTTYWPYSEGIWVQKDTESYLCVGAVYHNLMDIPEAKDQLEQGNDQFKKVSKLSSVRHIEYLSSEEMIQ